jgi:dCTP deaminase
MIIPAQTIRKVKPVNPFCERTKFCGVSFGLSSAGYDIRIAKSLRLMRGDFALASSMERFEMPNDWLGIVHDKSTWGRKGIAVQNTVIEPGWCGYLTIELTNHSIDNIWIEEGVGIAQIVFHRLEEPTEQPYTGKYQNQAAGVVPAIFEPDQT